MFMIIYSMLFAIIFTVMALSAIDREEWGWVAVLTIMAIINGTNFVFRLLEAAQL